MINKLFIGYLIRYYDWAFGGFLFGVIIEKEDELNIWRPKDN